MRRILWLLVAAVVGLLGWWGFRLMQDSRREPAAVPSVPVEPDSPIGRLPAAASGTQAAPEGTTTEEPAKKAAKKPAKKDAAGEAVGKTTAPKKSGAKKSAAKKSATKKSEPKKKPASGEKPKSP